MHGVRILFIMHLSPKQGRAQGGKRRVAGGQSAGLKKTAFDRTVKPELRVSSNRGSCLLRESQRL